MLTDHAPTTDALFHVELCDYPDLPEPQRQRAEARYAHILSRQLGGEGQVCDTLRLLQQLEDAPPDDWADDDEARHAAHSAQAACQRWLKATRAAAEAGLQGIGADASGSETCYFAIHLHGDRH